jgi:DNA-binding LacI/PurR family transcriptional regulator
VTNPKGTRLTETPATNGRAGATLEAVAREAGVSRATVSRVVNGSPKVSTDVRRSVEKAITRLGYVPNPAARSLVTRRSDSVGVVITEPTTRLFEEPFFPRLLRGINAELAANELQLVLLMPESQADEARLERYLAAGHVDGALLVSLHGDDPLPARLAKRGLPLVVAGRPPIGSSASYVDVDNRDAARTAVAHLIEDAGRTRVATISGPRDMHVGIDRLGGYHDALARAGLPADDGLIAEGDFTYEGGAGAMRTLLKARPDLDALFAASDLMAAGALSVLRAAGRRVPEDVAIAGFDDSAIAESADPPLTSVRQPIEEMGREMARLLFASITKRDAIPRHVILGTRLVRRASSRGGRAR